MKTAGRMRTTTLALLLAGLTVGSGCLKMEADLLLRKDATGKFSVEWWIRDNVTDQVQAVLRLQKQLAMLQSTNAPAIDNEGIMMQVLMPDQERLTKLIEPYTKYGVRVDHLRVDARDAQRHVTIRLLFDDLEKLAKADIFKRYGFNLSQRTNGDYQFSRTAVAPLDPKSIPPMKPADRRQSLAPVLNGMSVVFNLFTPGRIKASNASSFQTYRAQWAFRFEDDPNVLLTMQNQDMQVLFDGLDSRLPEVTGGGKPQEQ